MQSLSFPELNNAENWKLCITNNQICESSALYIVATPIGNLLDISLRALYILDSVDLILCEDTRKSGLLLSHFGIKTQKKSYRIHQIKEDTSFAIQQIQEGKRLAFISDAGTPGISDPCSELVRMVRKLCPETGIYAIPGASAMSAAMSISGWQSNPCQFIGFLPVKKGKKQKAIEQIRKYSGMSVIYESVHRIEKLMFAIRELNLNRDIMVLREMTKLYEETIFFEMALSEESWDVKINQIRKKGEFTVMIGPKK